MSLVSKPIDRRPILLKIVSFNSRSDINEAKENFKKKTAEIGKALIEIQKQKVVVAKQYKDAAITAECHRKKHRIFLRSTVELESRLQAAQEKLNQAIVSPRNNPLLSAFKL